MSGKYTKSKTKKKNHLVLWLGAAVPLAVLLAVIFLLPGQREEASRPVQDPVVGGMQVITPAQTQHGNKLSDLNISLGDDLEVQTIGSYTGIYMEDGSDELVTDVLMLLVVNNGENTVEYMKITMDLGDKTAEFTGSTLNPGASMVLLESARMPYDKTLDYGNASVVCENLSLFQQPLSLHEDKLEIQNMKGAINVTNISGEDIPGRIAIYYKNKAAGIYYGGITYRILLEDGLKAGEIRQLMASHFTESGSEIIFVTVAQ